MLSTMSHCLGAKNYVNLVIGSKQETPIWLSVEEAAQVSHVILRRSILDRLWQHCRIGASQWKFASTYEGENPDVVLVGIGVEVTFEVIAAAVMLHKMAPELRIRVVNVTDLMVLGPLGSHPHALSNEAFADLFTPDKPVHFSFHGYAIELKGLLFGRPNLDRTNIQGYQEEGTTTTPLAVRRRPRDCLISYPADTFPDAGFE